jgi:RHS repeat-associated protein
VGNRTQRNSTVPAIPATGLLNYDANDRTSTDSYDANGNLLSSGTGANVYDFENRLVAAGGVKLVYDGDGNRVKETVATVTTSYLVADQNLTGYAQVLDELQSGAVSRTYSYGLELISQRLTANGQGLSFYGFDGHGNVRFLTDSTGAITDTYDYDAFCNLISQTGTTPNNYLFAGEQFDPALGLYYNRARYYDQRQGRFWTMDTLEPVPFSVRELNRYTYVGDDPINGTDPSGQEELTAVGQLGAISVNTTVQAIAISAVLACATQLGIADTLDELGADVNPNAGLCVPRFSSDRKVLYHYTAFPNLQKITASGILWASLDTISDAFFGPGQYFTDITPAEAATRTKGQLAYALYAIPFKWLKTDVAYIGVNLPTRSAKRVSDVYGPSFPGRGIYLRLSVTPLKLTNKIVDTGVLTFPSQ